MNRRSELRVSGGGASLSLCVLACVNAPLLAQPDNNYRFEFDTLPRVEGAPGQVMAFSADIILTRAQLDVEGWSLSVAPVDPLVCSIADFDRNGTAAENADFVNNELTSGPDNAGFVAGVVLDIHAPFDVPPPLDENATPHILFRIVGKAVSPMTEAAPSALSSSATG